MTLGEKTIGKTEIFYMSEGIDLFKFAITEPTDGVFNYINDIIDTSFFNKTPEAVYVLGYPNPDNNTQLYWSQLRVFEGTSIV